MCGRWFRGAAKRTGSGGRSAKARGQIPPKRNRKVAAQLEFGLNNKHLKFGIPAGTQAMRNVPVTLVLAAALTVYLALDTAVILQSGKTPGLFYKFLRYRQRYGPITRKGRPRRHWSYIFGNVTVLALCIAYVAWALFSPETLNGVIR